MGLMRAFAASCVVGIVFLTVAGCSSSGPTEPSIQPAKTYALDDFTLGPKLRAGKPARLAFAITEPSGMVLTRYRRGPGPHTGIHLILVRSDLGVLIHRHPPLAQDGRIGETFNFPTPGRYRLVVDAYPASGGQRNLQFFRWITVPGVAPKDGLPPPATSEVVDGYRFVMHGRPRLHAIQAALLAITVTRPDGTPATFTPYYGALAHAIFFREKTLDYFHTHVCSPGAAGCTSILGATQVTGRSSAPGKLTVGVLVPVSGTWRLFLQTKVGGRILTAPFTLQVR